MALKNRISSQMDYQNSPDCSENKSRFFLKTAFIVAKAGKWIAENARTFRSLIETNDFGW
jgi:hypothetical protein